LQFCPQTGCEEEKVVNTPMQQMMAVGQQDLPQGTTLTHLGLALTIMWALLKCTDMEHIAAVMPPVGSAGCIKQLMTP
jgi:hypothetical protein